VIAVGEHSTAAALKGMGVPQVADVSQSTPWEQFNASKRQLNNRGACFQPDDGGKSGSLSDYAVFARIPTVEDHSGGSRQFNDVLANLDKTKINACFGWSTWDEHQWVSHITRAGAYAHASDFADNLAFMTNVAPLPPPAPVTPTVAPAAARAQAAAARARASNKHTVAFLTSDGDNVQLLEHVDFVGPNFYGSPLRGDTAVGWSYSPAMAALMPPVLGFVRRTLTANDSIAAGPSGAGYAYPQLFPGGPGGVAGRAFGKATAELMKASGQTLCSVIGVTPSAESVAELVKQDQVQGASAPYTNPNPHPHPRPHPHTLTLALTRTRTLALALTLTRRCKASSTSPSGRRAWATPACTATSPTSTATRPRPWSARGSRSGGTTPPATRWAWRAWCGS
jgi:hypothetical protein